MSKQPAIDALEIALVALARALGARMSGAVSERLASKRRIVRNFHRREYMPLNGCWSQNLAAQPKSYGLGREGSGLF